MANGHAAVSLDGAGGPTNNHQDETERAVGTVVEVQVSALERRIVFRRGLIESVNVPPASSILLNPGASSLPVRSAQTKANGAAPSQSQQRPEPPLIDLSDPTLPPEGKQLCEDVDIDKLVEWKDIKGATKGLVNLGNTCYLNSTLQCLAHTPALINWLRAYRSPKRVGFDWVLTLKGALDAMHAGGRQPYQPIGVVKNLRRLSAKFRPHRQEDAQEFASFLLEACQNVLLESYGGKVHPLVAETSPLRRVFGGWLRSRISWDPKEELNALRKNSPTAKHPRSKPVSDTFDPFTFLNLEIVGGSVQNSLRHFMKSEQLDASNMYRTPSGAYVRAKKCFSVFRPPRVLVVHLKRFVQHDRYGWTNKISRRVQYDEELDLTECLSRRAPCTYKLFGVIVHIGSSQHSGHYVAYARGANGVWSLFDDCSVRQVGIQEVLHSEAYMLFYQRKGPWHPPAPSPHHTPRTAPSSPATVPTTEAAEPQMSKRARRRAKFQHHEPQLVPAPVSPPSLRRQRFVAPAAVDADTNGIAAQPPRGVRTQPPTPRSPIQGSVREQPAQEVLSPPLGAKKRKRLKQALKASDGTAVAPAKKKRRAQYESQALNAEAAHAFEQPKDTAAYWKQVKKSQESASSGDEGDGGPQIIRTRDVPRRVASASVKTTTTPPPDDLPQSTPEPEPEAPAPVRLSAEAAVWGSAADSHRTKTRKSVVNAASEQQAATAQAWLTHRGEEEERTAKWEGVDTAGFDGAHQRRGPTREAAAAAVWNRAVDQPRLKKRRVKRTEEGGGSAAFQQRADRIEREREAERRRALEQETLPWGERWAAPISDRKRRKLAVKKIAEDTFK
eukprot:Hpha_TRINITY_DN14971_c4_g4::TRINITY_DN14971_c4_g4_i1::g.143945::m.143945/K11855/USP36_42; ubiquitin carboxyl-terminal hydrolase 36/42